MIATRQQAYSYCSKRYRDSRTVCHIFTPAPYLFYCVVTVVIHWPSYKELPRRYSQDAVAFSIAAFTSPLLKNGKLQPAKLIG